MLRVVLIKLLFSYSVFASFDRNIITNIVTDSNTTLEWQDDYSDNSGDVKFVNNWESAVSYCYNLNLSSILGVRWRLPHQRELLSLVDDTVANPAIKGFNQIEIGKYWSSSLHRKEKSKVFFVDFTTGSGSYQAKDTDNVYVRCVRTGYEGRAGPNGGNN